MSSPFDPDAAEPEPAAPTAARVAARLGVLVALAYRSVLESGHVDRPRPAEEAHSRLLAWVRDPALAAEIEPAERAAVARPLGAMPRREHIDLGWLSEGAAVLAWALGLVELPSYDQQAVGEEVANAIGFLAVPWDLPEHANLRAGEEVEARWSSALALHWRLREQKLRPGPMDFETFVEDCAWAPLCTVGLRLRDRDLLLGELPVSRADEDVFCGCMSIAQERHRAFEWLLGGEPLWSEVTTDT